MNVLVAMSGGVDSAVTAHLLSSNNHNIWGVHMILNDEVTCDIKTRSCCSTKDSNDAREMAQSLGVYFDAIPMQSQFKKAVIDNFISEYAAGRTPIPCTLCNGYLKFKLLFDYAESAGFTHIATGHYAKVDSVENLICPIIDKDGLIAKKDQTYYLWQIPAANISRTIFPIGESFCDKSAVREYAKNNNIQVAEKPDSQNICFIPSNDYRIYLREKRPDLFSDRDGNFIDSNGNIIGIHNGYWNFSVGQRARISGLQSARYVVEIDPQNNLVRVGEKEDGLSGVLTLVDTNIHYNLDLLQELWIKINANSPLHRVSSIESADNKIVVHLNSKVRVVKGQAGVIYGRLSSGKIAMLAGGWIR